MLSHKTNLLNKINTRDASVLFIGQNEFSQKVCISLASQGFQTYFYSDSTLRDVEKLMNGSVHVTDLVYDVYDVNVVVVSRPSSINSDSMIVDYLKEVLDVLKLVLHDGMLFLVDEALSKYSKDSISDRIKMLAYLDPADPILETYKEGLNYFFCEVSSIGAQFVTELIKAKNNDSHQLGIEFIKGAKL